MTHFGVDLSKYQGPFAMDGFDFAIFNVEDPTLGSKVAHAYDIGIRWDIYKWCYPGVSGYPLFNTAKARVDACWRPGTRYPQFFLDYEEGGVAPWQRDEWNQACKNAGMRPGFYVYLYLMNSQGLAFRDEEDGWLAYYPSNSADWFPSYSATAVQKGAELHQYTSTGGTLDRNVSLSDEWFHGGAPEPAPGPMPDLSFLEDDVKQFTAKGPDDQHWHICGVWKHKVTPAEVYVLSLPPEQGGYPAGYAIPFHGDIDQGRLNSYVEV